MTQAPIVRFAFVLVGFLVENLRLVLRWTVVARPAVGGRDLPKESTFKTISDWTRHILEEEHYIWIPHSYHSALTPMKRDLAQLTKQHSGSTEFFVISMIPNY